MPLAKLTGTAPGQNIAIAELNGVVMSISIRQARGVLHEGGGKVFAELQRFAVVLSEHDVPVCTFVLDDDASV